MQCCCATFHGLLWPTDTCDRVMWSDTKASSTIVLFISIIIVHVHSIKAGPICLEMQIWAAVCCHGHAALHHPDNVLSRRSLFQVVVQSLSCVTGINTAVMRPVVWLVKNECIDHHTLFYNPTQPVFLKRSNVTTSSTVTMLMDALPHNHANTKHAWKHESMWAVKVT